MDDFFFLVFLALLGIVIGIISQIVQPRARGQILLIFGLLLFVSAGLWLGFKLAAKELPPFSETHIPTLIVTPIETSSGVPRFVGFDFESGTEGWGTSEGAYKLASVSTTTDISYTGNSALELTTELFGNGSEDVYRHTEAVVYLNNNPLKGFDQPGPYDLTGKTFSCFVYLPADLVVQEATRTYIRLIAKDTKFANQFSQAVEITKDNTNKWIELSFVIDVNVDSDFDPKQTNALGVRLDTPDGSTLEYTGPIYIDHCSIETFPNQTLSLSEQLAKVDTELRNSLPGNISYIVPSAMKLDETFVIQLLINASLSSSELATENTESSGLATSVAEPGKLITDSGNVVTIQNNTIEITPNMKAILISADPQAFDIQSLHADDIQIVGSTSTTKWQWIIRAKKEGVQKLVIVIYRLIKIDGKENWREVESYKADIDVKVTFVQRVQSFDWKWIAGIIITLIGIPALWRYIDSQKKQIRQVPKPKHPEKKTK